MLRRAASAGVEVDQPCPGTDWPAITSLGIGGNTLGPPALRLSVPLTARIESRTSSAVRRRIGYRQYHLLEGSAASAAFDPSDAMR